MTDKFKTVDFSNERIYIYKKVETEETIQDMLKKYNIAMNYKGAKVKLLQELFKDYNLQKDHIFKDIQGNLNKCCLFWTSFGCCTLQTLVKICFFNVFQAKKWKRGVKNKNWCKYEQKTVFGGQSTQMLVKIYYK